MSNNMEAYPMGICLGISLGVLSTGFVDIGVDVGENFRNAANDKALTSETLCNELMRDNGFIEQLNESLEYQKITITNAEDCKATFRIQPK